ncbi:MAG: rhombosortase [Woeseiaceae bacterium]|nr:rhombosortase [Woeseiaceae bacterium]
MGLPQALENWRLPAGITLLTLLVGLLGDHGRVVLRFDRPAIEAGEAWRLVSGHFTHLGWSHWALNIAGLLLSWYLVGRAFGTRGWLLVIVASIAAIDLGFWFAMPGLNWYVGLSGMLHGLIAAGAIGSWPSRRLEAALIGGFVVFKLAYEIVAGPVPGSASAAGGNVITEAHLFGAIGGVLAALALRISVKD